MIKQFILVYKKAEMSRDDFCKHYVEHHGPIVARMPGLLRYIQNPTLLDPQGNAQEISGIAEVWYESEEAMRQALASPAAAAANESLATFVDTSRTRFIPVIEYTVPLSGAATD